jgi:DNA-binding transcriptional LysR family regulator
MPASILEWDDLRIVLAIAEHGTLSGAAAGLRISHPTLSRRLRRIEERLGTRLFERTPGAFRPTATGEDVRQLAIRMRDDIVSLERRIAGRDREACGPIRLTAPDAIAEYLLPGILADLCRSAPELTVEMIVSNSVLSLAQRSADVALRVTDRPDAGLRGRRVGSVAMAVYSTAPPTSAERGADVPWVGFDAALACSGPGRFVAESVPEAAIRLRANTLLAAAQAIRSGIGRGVLPCFVGGSIPELVPIGPPLPQLTTALWLLVHPEMSQVPRIRAALDLLADRVRAAAPLLAGEGVVPSDASAI